MKIIKKSKMAITMTRGSLRQVFSTAKGSTVMNLKLTETCFCGCNMLFSSMWEMRLFVVRKF